jgi:hypothetical protein
MYLREDGTPYYVGKGTQRRIHQRARNHHVPADRSRVLIQEFPTEADALAAEIFLIAYYGRKDNGTGILRNLTDGGEGMSNPSKETRQKLARPRGKHSPELIEKRLAPLRGRSHPPGCNHCRAITGHKPVFTDTWRERLRANRAGKGMGNRNAARKVA